MRTANLPTGTEVFLDHTGHFIADEVAARSVLENLGFSVTPFSAQVQPDPATGQPGLTGTGNICVMLPEGYLEFLLYTADTPIGREFLGALARRPGLHLAAFGVADAGRRHADLVAAGHAMRPLVRFSRDIETGNGPATAAFTVARLAEGAMPEGRVQMVTHGNSDAMWQPRWTGHDNGAQRLISILVSAPDPAEAAARFSGFLGVPAVADGPGFRVFLSRGDVEILPEPVATELVGRPVEPGRPAFAGVRIGVRQLGRIRDRLTASAPRSRMEGARLVAPFHPCLGPGVWLFEEV